MITTTDEFYYKCVKCQIKIDINDEDTLRFEESKGMNLIIYQTILQNAARDPLNPKVKKQCKFCKNNILRQVRLGEDMRLINICPECNEQWIEGQ